MTRVQQTDVATSFHAILLHCIKSVLNMDTGVAILAGVQCHKKCCLWINKQLLSFCWRVTTTFKTCCTVFFLFCSNLFTPSSIWRAPPLTFEIFAALTFVTQSLVALFCTYICLKGPHHLWNLCCTVFGAQWPFNTCWSLHITIWFLLHNFYCTVTFLHLHLSEGSPPQ